MNWSWKILILFHTYTFGRVFIGERHRKIISNCDDEKKKIKTNIEGTHKRANNGRFLLIRHYAAHMGGVDE